MEGKIFLLTYEDDRDISRRKWIVYKDKDDHLLWFYNPIHDLRVESVPLASIKRMEERNLEDLLFYGKDKGLNPDEIQNKISEALGYSGARMSNIPGCPGGVCSCGLCFDYKEKDNGDRICNKCGEKLLQEGMMIYKGGYHA